MKNNKSDGIYATFVCLANSRKHSGRCLAGKARYRGKFDKWIRPISERIGEELHDHEHRTQMGEEVQILDVLEIKLIEHKPKLHQQENYLMDVSVPLRKIGTFSVKEIMSYVDKPASLWGTGYSSSKGLNDYVPIEKIAEFKDSLYLINVKKLIIEIAEEYKQSTRRRKKVFRAGFELGGEMYKLTITDPNFEEKFNDKVPGSYEIEDSLLTISLGEEFNSSHYKLVAGILPLSYGEKWSVH